jgi:hypothetical protein
MHSEQVELQGRIVDSLLSPKAQDEIIAREGAFFIEELIVRERREDPDEPSFASRRRMMMATASLTEYNATRANK